MFFAFIGSPEAEADWRASVVGHARWLGLAAHLDTQLVEGSRCLVFGWLTPRLAPAPDVQAEDGQLRLPTSLTAAGRTATPAADNLIWVEVALPAGEVRVAVPLGTPEPFYYARDRRGWMLGNDARLLARWLGAELDERALFALFQYGAIPAPLTMARGVRRVPSGHALCLTPSSAEADIQRVFSLTPATPEPETAAAAERDPAARVAATLDELLSRMAPSTLYFSGGVDSSLLAARLLGLGFSSVRLINFSFGPDDLEGQHAQRVAAHLGLACDQITYDPTEVVPMLERIGRDYSFPFVDRSVIPTNLLVTASRDLIQGNRVVLEGTGADGAFGAWSPHSRVAQLPWPARQALASGYGWLGLWRQPTEFERVARLARGSVQMPPAHALVIAQNVLDQIAYRMPASARQEIETALGQHVEVLGAGMEVEQQFSLLDLVHICAGIFAAKSFDPLRTAGIRPVYPFLEPPMLRLSAALSYADKSAPGRSKAVLRGLLARQLPSELIERPKSGFIPPMRAILARPDVQAFVHAEVLRADNPVLAWCDQRIAEQMLTRAAHDQPLAGGAIRFLWAVIFASCWLRQSEY